MPIPQLQMMPIPQLQIMPIPQLQIIGKTYEPALTGSAMYLNVGSEFQGPRSSWFTPFS